VELLSSGKGKKLYTPKQTSFLTELQGAAKGNLEKARELSEYANNTAISDIVRPLKDEILDIAQEILAVNAARAATELADFLDSPTQLGGKEKLMAIKEILDRVGISRTERIEVQVKRDNIFILPPKVIGDSNETEVDAD
jgi:hypothetical protein